MSDKVKTSHVGEEMIYLRDVVPCIATRYIESNLLAFANIDQIKTFHNRRSDGRA